MDLLVAHHLKQGLRSRGCVICRIGEASGGHYLSTLLHEYVNDLSTRVRLAASWGFCRRHSWSVLELEWARFRDGMSTANLAQWQLGRVLARLRQAQDRRVGRRRRRWWWRGGDDHRVELSRRLEPTRACPACDSERQSEEYAVLVLLEHLGEDPEVTRLFRESSGLCLGHLRVALGLGDRKPGLEVLLETERVRLEQLVGELEAYLRKHDHRFSHEPYGVEVDAFVRATEVLAGGSRELLGHGPVELPESPESAERPR